MSKLYPRLPFYLVAAVMLLFTALAISPPHGTAAVDRKANLKELAITTSQTHLILFGTLENSINEEMLEILHSGLPLQFTFQVELHKTTSNWPAEQITSFSFHHAMTYDTLKEVYRVTFEEENNRVQSFKSLQEAQNKLNEINGARVVKLGQLIPDNLYTLKIRAELYQKTLPMNLHDILPFFSWWDVETEWHTIEFRY